MTILPFRAPADVEAAVPRVAAHFAGGGLLGYPTETVYGLGSTPTDDAVAALARLKGRREGKPFLLLVAGRDMAQRNGLLFSGAAQRLADHFWPGPLTLVLAGGEGKLPDTLRGPEGGIAVRWTSHATTALLVERLGHPITSTSANRPGEPTAAGPTAIADQFREEVRRGELLILDGGTIGSPPPSTVVDCTLPAPRLIRAGAIPVPEIRNVIGSLAP
jgi:L-threonylcarbamoyladenylate synthase